MSVTVSFDGSSLFPVPMELISFVPDLKHKSAIISLADTVSMASKT